MLIRLNDDYVIDHDGVSYNLAKDTHTVDKNGKPIYQPKGFFSRLETAVAKFTKIEIVNANTSMSLKEYVDAYKQSVDRLERLLKP